MIDYLVVSKIYVDSMIDCVYNLDENLSSKSKNKVFVLHTVKNIGGNYVEIPMSMESSGTKNYLWYFNCLLNITGEERKIIVADEFSIHLHENLKKRIFEYIVKEARENDVQVVITTHDISLINSEEVFLKETYNYYIYRDDNVILYHV